MQPPHARRTACRHYHKRGCFALFHNDRLEILQRDEQKHGVAPLEHQELESRTASREKHTTCTSTANGCKVFGEHLAIAAIGKMVQGKVEKRVANRCGNLLGANDQALTVDFQSRTTTRSTRLEILA